MGKQITLHGNDRTQGQQHGEGLRETIQANTDRVNATIAANVQAGMSYERYMDFVYRGEAFLQREHPELTEELHGIAEGSNVSYDDILRLNIAAYFMQEYFRQECSMLLARGPATSDGHTYLIKNRDMRIEIEQVLMRREYPDGLVLTEVNGAGTITYPALVLNSYGLAATNTGFWSELEPVDVDLVDRANFITNTHLLLRACRNVEEVLKYLETFPRVHGINMMFADRKEAVAAELSATEIWLERDEGRGILYRTNHRVLPQGKDKNPAGYSSTYHRYERIGELVKERYGRLRFQDLLRILSDHDGGADAICRHPSPEAAARTMSCSIIDLEEGEVWTTAGNPCEALPHAFA